LNISSLEPEDARKLLVAADLSRDFHYPWISLPATLREMEDYLDQRPESRISYAIREAGGDLAGVVSLSSIICGAFQNAFLGSFALVPIRKMAT
jgi:[ribosomal protein S5]-alanine N-acetyltransferase